MTTPMSARFALDAIAPSPWKNGGGLTREIAAWPPGAAMDEFDWRVSVADIAADGPFSAFPGIDRHIALLHGAGVVLRAANGGWRHQLAQRGEPFSFAGEESVLATLTDGPTRDFNVMTRRDRCRARIDALRHAFTVEPGDHAVILFVVEGEWHLHGVAPLHAGDGIVWEAGSPVADDMAAGRAVISPARAASLCLRVQIEPEPH